MTSVEDNLKKAREAQLEKHGDNYPQVMAEKARKSHKAQLLKYGGKRGLSEEMRRRRLMRDDLKDDPREIKAG